MDSHCSWISGSRRSTRDFPFAVLIEAAILRNVLRRIAGSKATVEVLPGDGRYPAQRWRTAGRLRLMNDKVIVITGASSGIGAAVARRATAAPIPEDAPVNTITLSFIRRNLPAVLHLWAG